MCDLFLFLHIPLHIGAGVWGAQAALMRTAQLHWLDLASYQQTGTVAYSSGSSGCPDDSLTALPISQAGRVNPISLVLIFLAVLFSKESPITRVPLCRGFRRNPGEKRCLAPDLGAGPRGLFTM